MGRGLGPGDVEHCGVKAVLVELDSDVSGFHMCTGPKGSEVGDSELPQAGCGVEGGGEAAVNSSISWLVQLKVPFHHKNEVWGVGHPFLLP